MDKKCSPATTIKFLEIYEKYPCLWNVRFNLYKDREARENAYDRLLKEMEIPEFGIAEVKTKIHSIRNAYTLELNKIAKSKKSGAGADELYKSKVGWFSVAHRILHQVVQIRESQSTGLIESASSDEKSTAGDSAPKRQSTLVCEKSTQSSSNFVVNTQSIDEIVADSQSHIHQMGNVDIENITVTRTATDIPPTPKRLLSTRVNTTPRTVTTKKTSQRSTEKALAELQEISQRLNEPQQEQNEFDYFGQSITCQLKKMPEELALQSMAYIQSYLVQQRLKGTKGTNNGVVLLEEGISLSPFGYSNSRYSSESTSVQEHENIPSQLLYPHTSDILSEAIMSVND